MPDYIMFWRVTEPNRQLSQWYPSKIVEDGITFCSAEQYMMYHKAMLFGDTVTANKILMNDSPQIIKNLGRLVANFDENIWVENREKIILQGNYLKFSQNAHLKRFLLRCPADAIFVEASPYDRIYGIGYSAKTAIKNHKKWGLNLLGKALNETYKLLV